MLSGCWYKGGTIYKTSSWQPISNPFSKPKDDNQVMAENGDYPKLPKQDVTTPPDGYLNNHSRDMKSSVANNTQKPRSESDPLGNLHQAGLAHNVASSGSGSAATAGNVSSTASPTNETALARNTSGESAANLQNYGTVSPIEPGFVVGSGQQMVTGSVQNANTQNNTGVATTQQPGISTDQNAWLYANQSPANTVQSPSNATYQQDPSYFPGQPGIPAGQVASMTAQQTGNPPSYPYSVTPDMMSNSGFATSSMPASPGGTQIASTQGLGYVGQSFGSHETAQMPYYTNQPGMSPPNNIPQNNAIPNNPMTTSPSGVNGTVQDGVSGMTNPAATIGTSAYPVSDDMIPTMQQPTQPMYQAGQSYTYPTQPANNGFQSGFNYYGPSLDDTYRPGGIATY